MAVDMFLKLDGIDGGSEDQMHKDELDVESWSFGESQPGTKYQSGGGGGGAGKVKMQDLLVTSRVDKHTPVLFLACATGEHIKKAVLTMRQSSEDAAGQASFFDVFLKVTLEDVLVSSYQVGGSAGSDSIPTDQISLNFAKIEYEYNRQSRDGTNSISKGGWDVVANKKL